MRERFPPARDLLAVYSVVAAFVYGWTLVILFYKLPSFLLFATPGELFAIVTYVLATALLESLVVIALLAGVAFLLPARFFRDVFVVRASWLAMIGYGSIILFLNLNAAFEKTFGAHVDTWSIVTVVLCLAAAWVSPRVKAMRSIAEWASDRFQVFLFLSFPLSLISLLVVIIRNLA
jgi:hypothetical protein